MLPPEYLARRYAIIHGYVIDMEVFDGWYGDLKTQSNFGNVWPTLLQK
jgi:hypothetical protein